jgi:hypothetical protein
MNTPQEGPPDPMADKPDIKNGRTTISENALLCVSIGLVGISSLSATVLFALLAMSRTNAALASLGSVSGVIGSGVSIWFTLRIRRVAFVAVSVWSLLPLAFWFWIFFEIFNGRLRM